MTGICDVIVEDARWQEAGLEPLAEQAAAATLRHLGFAPEVFEISLLGCDDARIAGLNVSFRDKPGPTNVLSWPSEERGARQDGEIPAPPDPDADPELGDIAISYDTCAREAGETGKPFPHHVTHLVVHGVLHLLGYDHQRDGDAGLMEGLETAILKDLGLPDPYGSDESEPETQNG